VSYCPPRSYPLLCPPQNLSIAIGPPSLKISQQLERQPFIVPRVQRFSCILRYIAQVCCGAWAPPLLHAAPRTCRVALGLLVRVSSARTRGAAALWLARRTNAICRLCSARMGVLCVDVAGPKAGRKASLIKGVCAIALCVMRWFVLEQALRVGRGTLGSDELQRHSSGRRR
jgi:hypothetical protein